IIVCMVPWRMLRSAEVAGSGSRRAHFYYWLAVVVGGLAVSLLLMLGRGGAPELGVEALGDAAAVPVTSTRQLVSWLVILVLILVVQGACWEMARRKIREVSDSAADTAMKLRQLENLEIFFDLPLYAGLAMTIFAFILIATLGAGVSRFLAYSSTFVGILFAVALRVGHLYPLRDKLIRQQEV
ncbi:MAG: hypothetical protein LC725_06305, partial [Lentisphaerae bacterium]|nr:hypothetical protein [Lentisphaerota bacterium]